MQSDVRDREEKLARVEMKMMAWVSTKLCRSVVMEVVNNAVKRVDNQHLSRIVADMMDEAWRRMEVNRLVDEVTDGDGEIRRRVEKILSSKRAEEMELLENVERAEAKQRRIERITLVKKIWSKKMEAKNLRTMLRMLDKLSLEDLEMEVDEIELKAMEMMEVVSDDGDQELVEMMDNDILEESDGMEVTSHDNSHNNDDLEMCVDTGDEKDKENKDRDIVGIKYCPGMEPSLPRYEFRRYKPHCSREPARPGSGPVQDEVDNEPNNTLGETAKKTFTSIIISNDQPQTEIFLGVQRLFQLMVGVTDVSGKRKRESVGGLAENKRRRGLGATGF